ncbi:MAG: S9 family peptidase [Micromonosporaceae bacterium]
MSETPVVAAPVAKRVPVTRTHHGDPVVDEYAWLADRDDPDTLAYLKAENQHTEATTAHLATLREEIFDEIKARTQETDLSVPVRRGAWWYYSRTEEGKQYAIHCRLPASGDEPPEVGTTAPGGEQVLLDENAEAGDSGFFSLGTFQVSPDGHRLAYATDFEGNERFTLRIRDLTTGETLADEIPDTFYGAAWSADTSTLFYLTVDAQWRPNQVWRHRVGTPAGDDTVIYSEDDERFWVSVEATRSEAYVLIDIGSKITSEVRYIPAGDPDAEPTVVLPRRQGVEYAVEHSGEDFLILHNAEAPNFELARAPVADPAALSTVIAHDEGTRLLDIDAFADRTVVHFRRDGLTGLRILPVGGDPHEISFPEPLYTVSPGANPEYGARLYRLSYTSLVTPRSVYDYDPASRELVLRKQEPVLGGYDPGEYEQHREWATASDGTRVPISIVCRKDTPRDGSAPFLLYGYGSYENSLDPWFAIPRLSLLDRGFVFGVAHVRGGGEMGRAWYENGKFGHKKNTFTDFVTCARHVVSAGWTSTPRLVARGGSAGGLLMGAIANLAPDAFGGIVAEVPFVDPLNSILDPSLPLTVIEWEEWGNPLADASVYEYMKSYAPYENVAPVAYPPILVATSLNDTRVLYHEPAKWIAKLRAVGQGGPFLMKTELGAGHAGPSGRYDAWREQAFILAWIIDTAAAS